MGHEISPNLIIEDSVYKALSSQMPVVALESTVITHGLPYPENRDLANHMEAEVRQAGAVPATIAVLDGKIRIGLAQDEIERLSVSGDVHKISSRDMGAAIARRWSGGTTVAATMSAAHSAGIKCFATGGIGGVHRFVEPAPGVLNTDISADLPQLAHTPMIVVCAGAKAILDLPATVEYLETWSVPVVGYQVDEFPAFYSPSSGLPVSARADTPEEVVQIARVHWSIGMKSSILVAQPLPAEDALPFDQVDQEIRLALAEASRQGIHGQQTSPFLLKRVSELTHGDSLRVNLRLLLNNARLAARIAIALSKAS